MMNFAYLKGLVGMKVKFPSGLIGTVIGWGLDAGKVVVFFYDADGDIGRTDLIGQITVIP